MRTEGRKPVLIVIAGPNGSGKTSVTSKILQHEWMEDSVYINPDIVAQEKFGDWNSMEAIKKAVVYCEEWREKCLVEIDYIERAKEADFFVRLFFVCTKSPAINASRIAQRVMKGGHDVPITKVISRYQKSILNCKYIATKVDRTYLYDNSVDDAEQQLLIRLSDGIIAKKYVEQLPEWARQIIE